MDLLSLGLTSSSISKQTFPMGLTVVEGEGMGGAMTALGISLN